MDRDYLDSLPLSDTDAIRGLREERITAHADPRYREFQNALAHMPDLRTSYLDFSNGVVRIGRPDEASEEQKRALLSALRAFLPWKKGPFELFGERIDAEWRSDMKWDRICEYLPDLQSKVVADIGCNNGYFMLRLLERQPKYIVGFEPYTKHRFSFDCFRKLIELPTIALEPLGIEHIDLYESSFDCILCLGILYHHTDPVGLLRKCYASMKKGATIIVECQGILNEDSIALVPEGRYANARGIWSLPSPSCLSNWLRRSQFRDIECFSAQYLSTAEQRRTDWAPIDSLEDFLDPENPMRTIEGYPAPARIYLRARR